MKEGAGYTHDIDVCKRYNENLVEMWSKLSKFIVAADKSPLDKSVLHNIGIMIKAYLDHVDPAKIYQQTEYFDPKHIDIEGVLSPIIHGIRNKIDVDSDKVDIKALITILLNVFRKFRGEATTIECTLRKEREIESLINLSYQKLVLNANCNNKNEDIQTIADLLPRANPNMDTDSKINPSILELHNLYLKSKRSANIDYLETDNSSKYNFLKSSSSNKALNIEYCTNLAIDQFLSVIKFILTQYLRFDDCQKYESTKAGMEVLIENTLGYQAPKNKNDDKKSKYRDLVRLLVTMQVKELNRVFKTSANNVINKQELDQFLQDINDLNEFLNSASQHSGNSGSITRPNDSFGVNPNSQLQFLATDTPLTPFIHDYTKQNKVEYTDVRSNQDSNIIDRNKYLTPMSADKITQGTSIYLNNIDHAASKPSQSLNDALGDLNDQSSVNYSKSPLSDSKKVDILEYILESLLVTILNNQNSSTDVQQIKDNLFYKYINLVANLSPHASKLKDHLSFSSLNNPRLPDSKFKSDFYRTESNDISPSNNEYNVLDNSQDIRSKYLKPNIFSPPAALKVSANTHDSYLNTLKGKGIGKLKGTLKTIKTPFEYTSHLYHRNSINDKNLSFSDKLDTVDVEALGSQYKLNSHNTTNLSNHLDIDTLKNVSDASKSNLSLFDLESDLQFRKSNTEYPLRTELGTNRDMDYENTGVESKSDKKSDAEALLNNYLNFKRIVDKTREPEAGSTRTSMKSEINDYLPVISSDFTSNGDVELSYIYDHPQLVVFQPQVLVKRHMSYYDYIKNFKNIFNDAEKNQRHINLHKIVRFLPNNKLQVLYNSGSTNPSVRVMNAITYN